MDEVSKYSTSILFSTPTFITGAGSVINLAGNYYEFNSSESGSEADEMAIENDFRMIGQDIKIALDKFKRNNKKSLLAK